MSLPQGLRYPPLKLEKEPTFRVTRTCSLDRVGSALLTPLTSAMRRELVGVGVLGHGLGGGAHRGEGIFECRGRSTPKGHTQPSPAKTTTTTSPYALGRQVVGLFGKGELGGHLVVRGLQERGLAKPLVRFDIQLGRPVPRVAVPRVRQGVDAVGARSGGMVAGT